MEWDRGERGWTGGQTGGLDWGIEREGRIGRSDTTAMGSETAGMGLDMVGTGLGTSGTGSDGNCTGLPI